MAPPQAKSPLGSIFGTLLYALLVLFGHKRLPTQYHSLLLRTIPAAVFWTAYRLAGSVLPHRTGKPQRQERWRWKLGRRQTGNLPPEIEHVKRRLLLALSSEKPLEKIMAGEPLSEEVRRIMEEISLKDLTPDDLSRILSILEAQL